MILFGISFNHFISFQFISFQLDIYTGQVKEHCASFCYLDGFLAAIYLADIYRFPCRDRCWWRLRVVPVLPHSYQFSISMRGSKEVSSTIGVGEGWGTLPALPRRYQFAVEAWIEGVSLWFHVCLSSVWDLSDVVTVSHVACCPFSTNIS